MLFYCKIRKFHIIIYFVFVIIIKIKNEHNPCAKHLVYENHMTSICLIISVDTQIKRS